MCKYMKWDYWTYLKQPVWFIETIGLINDIDSEYAKIQSKELNSKKHG